MYILQNVEMTSVQNIMYSKLPKKLREILLAERKTFRIPILFETAFAKKDFDYVVTKKQKPKVAFWSGQTRKTGDLCYTFSKIDQEVQRPAADVGPGSYDSQRYVNALASTKVVSSVGVGGIARKAARFKCGGLSEVPGPGHYTVDGRPTSKVNKYPFNSIVARDTTNVNNVDTPGVSNYDIPKRRNELPMKHSFGGRVTLDPIVQFKCTTYNTDLCSMCSKKPVGDYWISNNESEMPVCNSCFVKQNLSMELNVRTYKPNYKKIRDCSEIHSHEGTTATIPLISEKENLIRTIREAYLQPYTTTKVIKQIKPASKKRKSTREHIQIGSGPSNGIKKELAKFIDSLYEHTDAEYLEERDTSDERLIEIMTPSQLVPDRERLMQHLLSELEPYPIKDYPKDFPPVRRKKQTFEVSYQYKYEPVNYRLEDIILDDEVRTQMEEQNWFKIYDRKKGTYASSETGTKEFEEQMSEEVNKEQDTEEEREEQTDEEDENVKYYLEETYLDKRIEGIVKDEVNQIEKSMMEVIKNIAPDENIREWSKEKLDGIESLQVMENVIIEKNLMASEKLSAMSPLDRFSKIGASESIEYGLRMLLRPFWEPIDQTIQEIEAKAPIEVKEEELEESTKVDKLEFLQDPNIPPLPKVINVVNLEMDLSEVDEDIISVIGKSSTVSLPRRSLSSMTVASAEGFPHFTL